MSPFTELIFLTCFLSLFASNLRNVGQITLVSFVMVVLSPEPLGKSVDQTYLKWQAYSFVTRSEAKKNAERSEGIFRANRLYQS